MNEMIYNPLEEFDGKFKALHLEKTESFLEKLITQSGIDIEANRQTVKEYDTLKEGIKKLRKRFNLWRFLRVLMCISLVLIPLVIIKTTPKIRGMRAELEETDQRISDSLERARLETEPLRRLFTPGDAFYIIEETIPALSFASSFSKAQEVEMIQNYDYDPKGSKEECALDVVSGRYNGNPFLFEKRRVHRMGTEVYYGTKVIHWTETYRGSDGKTHTRVRTQTLHASVTKPKPFYHTETLLDYCSQGGPDLSFTRDATHLDQKSEKEIDRYVKRGEKKLKKMTDAAIKENRDFMSMSNSDFEVLFDALDRTNEVQFRTLFTPLAQTNMVDLIRSQSGYGDDFHFIKKKRSNRIVTKHSRGRPLTLHPSAYDSHSFDIIKEHFIERNVDFFKAIYFDFAPLLAIPMYQESPDPSLDPIPEQSQSHASKEYEALANVVGREYILHSSSRTEAIFRTEFVNARDGGDEIEVTAHSYDIIPRIDFIPVHGGDGRWHNVPVPWDEYIPLERISRFLVTEYAKAKDQPILAGHGSLCIYQ